MTVTEVLLKAKNLIRDPKNWVKGSYDTYEGQYCLVGALRKAVDGITDLPEAKAARRRVYCQVGDQIESWNDAPSTLHVDVMNAIDRAIADERANA